RLVSGGAPAWRVRLRIEVELPTLSAQCLERAGGMMDLDGHNCPTGRIGLWIETHGLSAGCADPGQSGCHHKTKHQGAYVCAESHRTVLQRVFMKSVIVVYEAQETLSPTTLLPSFVVTSTAYTLTYIGGTLGSR